MPPIAALSKETCLYPSETASSGQRPDVQEFLKTTAQYRGRKAQRKTIETCKHGEIKQWRYAHRGGTARSGRAPEGQRDPSPEWGMKAPARRKATLGRAETRGGFRADSREGQEKTERRRQLCAVCPPLPSPLGTPPCPSRARPPAKKPRVPACCPAPPRLLLEAYSSRF